MQISSILASSFVVMALASGTFAGGSEIAPSLKADSSNALFEPYRVVRVVEGEMCDAIDSERARAEEQEALPAVVSGDETLDAYLDLILDSVVGRDEGALERAYEWIGSEDTFPYIDMDYFGPDEPWEEWSVPCAIEMARRQTGNCYRYASLLCWVARALGYDARTVSGYVLMSNGWVAHGWVEVEIDGQTLVMDPQQHARPVNEGLDLFLVSYDEAPLYYIFSLDEAW